MKLRKLEQKPKILAQELAAICICYSNCTAKNVGKSQAWGNNAIALARPGALQIHGSGSHKVESGEHGGAGRPF